MAYRIGDNAKFNSIQMLIRNSQAKVSSLQIMSSTGRAGENYADIADKSNQALKLENSYIRIKRYQENIKTADANIDQYEASISRAQDIATQLRTLLTSALNATNSSTMGLDVQAKSLLDNLQSELNKQVDGKYIFAGTLTNTAPVDITRWGNPPAAPNNLNAPAAYTLPAQPGVPTTFPVTIAANATSDYFGYFTANTTLPTVRANDNMTVNYGVSAADPAFANLIYALRSASTVNGTPTAEQTDRMNGALTAVNSAISGLADMRASVGAKGRLLLDTNKSHEDYLAKIESLVLDIQGADVTETISKLSAEQTQLEASFMTISRLSQVSLVRFLQ